MMIKQLSKVTCSAMVSLAVLLFVNTEASSATQRKSSASAPHSYWDTYKEAKDYASGGLEDAPIRKMVCDILEGGEHAFRERARRLRVRLER